MNPRPFQTFCARLCLVVFTFTSVCVPRGVVVCQDGHGTRLEFGCEKNRVRHCEDSFVAAQCAESSVNDDCGSKPCRDTPLRPELVVRGGDRQRVSLPAPVPAFTIPMAPPESPELPQSALLKSAHVTCGSWMPPPAAAYLRSVILLV